MLFTILYNFIMIAFRYKTRSVKVVQFNYVKSSVDGVL